MWFTGIGLCGNTVVIQNLLVRRLRSIEGSRKGGVGSKKRDGQFLLEVSHRSPRGVNQNQKCGPPLDFSKRERHTDFGNSDSSG